MCEPRIRDNGASDVWALTAYCLKGYFFSHFALMVFFFIEYVLKFPPHNFGLHEWINDSRTTNPSGWTITPRITILPGQGQLP